jgi:AcrR family transcriptional regulator
MRQEYRNVTQVPSQDPRANQKARTRSAIVEAAAAILRRGASPTVAEAADLARVSRATAYRYFPTQPSLLLEVVDLRRASAPVEEMVQAPPEGDHESRLLALVDRFTRIVLAEQTPMRTALRLYLDTWLQRGPEAKEWPLREGRRLRWLDEVLAPVRRKLSPAKWRRLRAALALVLGVEAMVVLKDVCGIEDDAEAVDVLRFAASAILQSATAAAPRPKPRSPR